MKDDELLDLVDKNDAVIGTINRKDYRTLVNENLGFIRAAEMFILNDTGQIWVPVRTADKTIAPNGFDFSAAGHVGAGDDYLDTMIRETKEELNLEISANDIELIAKLKSPSERYFRAVYLLRSNETPEYNPDDFVSAEWMTPGELMAAIESGHPTKKSLASTILVLQRYLQDIR